ncbi:hypothetical protein CPT_Saba_014 [Proteus phage Saba]|uniref:Uncharacterized protein n=1 Tax=Proteus phage Saba TaxID=2596672 RepID=A0A5B9N5B8_9CAUD|nr:hypothetical protein JT320_gp14 [Proteus phage Saba]QEG09387.1 hypothetical protein CPT_Saba_014 [Proteus phage Saba]
MSNITKIFLGAPARAELRQVVKLIKANADHYETIRLVNRNATAHLDVRLERGTDARYKATVTTIVNCEEVSVKAIQAGDVNTIESFIRESGALGSILKAVEKHEAFKESMANVRKSNDSEFDKFEEYNRKDVDAVSRAKARNAAFTAAYGRPGAEVRKQVSSFFEHVRSLMGITRGIHDEVVHVNPTANDKHVLTLRYTKFVPVNFKKLSRASSYVLEVLSCVGEGKYAKSIFVFASNPTSKQIRVARQIAIEQHKAGRVILGKRVITGSNRRHIVKNCSLFTDIGYGSYDVFGNITLC